MKLTKVIFLFATLLCFSCLTPEQKLVKAHGFKNGIFAKITTEKGVILCKLEFEKTPITVANFIGLAQGIIPNDFKKPGEPFYDGLKFHRVIKNGVMIGGCPKGDGTGQPGYLFKDEFDQSLRHNKAGILSMANPGPNSNGSQFAISLQPNPDMDDVNTVFGETIGGLDVLPLIQQGDHILKIEILKIGKKAIQFNPLSVFEENGFSRTIKK